MSFTAVIVGGAALAGGIYAANKSSDAAQNASNAQVGAANAGIQQQQNEFDAVQKLLAPYATAGTGALSAQQDLLGLNGAGPQGSAISAIQSGPQFAALQASGDRNILANASATGGLRGGNTQAALAQFSPSLLSQLIQQQFGNLGGLTSVGQNAAAGTGNAGMSTGNNITTLLGQVGASQAGNALAQGKAGIQLGNSVTSGIGTLASAGYNGFGGGYAAPNVFGQYSNPTATTPFTGVDQFSYLGGPSTAGDYSDVRLKKNIRRIGTTRKGNSLYEWDWKTGGKGSGVLAQEVTHVPGAVAFDPAGLLTVDYSKV